MSLRSILLILAAFLLTAGTVLVARGWIDSQRNQLAQPAPAPVVEAPQVLVASRDLPIGVFLKKGDLRWQDWPSDNLPKSYLVADTAKDDDLYGAVVRRSFSAGEPITADRIIKPGDRGFLAAVLQAGYRAVAIPVSAASGVSGLIFPGDRVDILLTQTLQPAADGEAEQRASETVLTNVRVLAMDQKVDDQDGQPKLAKTATLEVLPKQAEILAVVRELGALSVSLRSLAKDEEELRHIAEGGDPLEEPVPESGKTYTWDSEASLLVPDRTKAQSDTVVVRVARGKEVEELSFKRK